MYSLAEWVNRFELANEHFTSFHLDEVQGVSFSGRKVLESSLLIMEDLLTHHSLSPQLRLIRLAWPLESAGVLIPETPTLGNLELDSNEPPSICLCKDPVEIYRPFFEEYRIPIEFPQALSVNSGIQNYYSCFRSTEARVRGWEFSRVIWSDLLIEG